jgi:hypothetical protein
MFRGGYADLPLMGLASKVLRVSSSESLSNLQQWKVKYDSIMKPKSLVLPVSPGSWFAIFSQRG